MVEDIGLETRRAEDELQRNRSCTYACVTACGDDSSPAYLRRTQRSRQSAAGLSLSSSTSFSSGHSGVDETGRNKMLVALSDVPPAVVFYILGAAPDANAAVNFCHQQCIVKLVFHQPGRQLPCAGPPCR